MSWFDVSVFLCVVFALVYQFIRQEFERSAIRRQLLVEQNLSPNNNSDDEIAPVRFIWHILDEYYIPAITNVPNNSTSTAAADNNNNIAAYTPPTTATNLV